MWSAGREMSLATFNETLPRNPTPDPPRICPSVRNFLQTVHKSQDAPAAQQVRPPDAIVAQRELTRQPVQIVVIDVESLFGIDASAAAECGVENLPILRRLGGFGQNDDHFGVGAAFLE